MCEDFLRNSEVIIFLFSSPSYLLSLDWSFSLSFLCRLAFNDWS